MKPSLADCPYNRVVLLSRSDEVVASLRLSHEDKSKMRGACRHLADALDRAWGSRSSSDGTTLRRWSGLHGPGESTGLVRCGPGAHAFSCPPASSSPAWSGSAICVSTSGSCAFPKMMPSSSNTGYCSTQPAASDGLLLTPGNLPCRTGFAFCWCVAIGASIRFRMKT